MAVLSHVPARLVKSPFCMWMEVPERCTLRSVTSVEPAQATADRAVDRRPATSAGVQATLAVLDLLAARSPLSLSEISRELGTAKSTLHRVCSVLVERGWAVRDSDGRFSLGIRALRLGSSSSELPIVTAFRTVAAKFLTRQDETIALAIVDGGESLFVALEETSQPVRLVTHVGSKTPAFASASGRVVLASQPPASVAAMYGGKLLVTPTGRRLNGVAELQTILEEVRERGYADNWEETAEGLYALSVPVTNDDGVTLAALTTLVPISRITPERRELLVADLRLLGLSLSQLVGWLPAFASRRP
jgi:DNA-binding IclR family transcriptional regulator